MNNLSIPELSNKLNNYIKENNILHKQLIHIKSEYGELLLRDSDNSRQLTELLSESAELSSEVERLRVESELKTRECGELRVEVVSLRENYEKAKKEVEKLMKKNKKIKLENEVIFEAANVKYRRFESRVVALERNLAIIKSVSLGEQRQRVDIAHPTQATTESLGSDKLGPAGTQTTVCVTTPSEQNSASSISCPKGASRVPAADQKLSFGAIKRQEGLVRCQTGNKTMPPIAVKTGSSEPIADTKTISTPIFISDSDEEDEPKGLKRKLDFTVASDRYKTPMAAPKLCEHNISGISTKQWECEAHMVDELEKNTELCMKAVCVLYKQHTTVGKSKGFRDIDAFRGMVLGKFLVDGYKDGRLMKSAADLKDYILEGPSKCRSLAIAHSSRLFEIYKNKEDPHFSPLN